MWVRHLALFPPRSQILEYFNFSCLQIMDIPLPSVISWEERRINSLTGCRDRCWPEDQSSWGPGCCSADFLRNRSFLFSEALKIKQNLANNYFCLITNQNHTQTTCQAVSGLLCVTLLLRKWSLNSKALRYHILCECSGEAVAECLHTLITLLVLLKNSMLSSNSNE